MVVAVTLVIWNINVDSEYFALWCFRREWLSEEKVLVTKHNLFLPQPKYKMRKKYDEQE